MSERRPPASLSVWLLILSEGKITNTTEEKKRKDKRKGGAGAERQRDKTASDTITGTAGLGGGGAPKMIIFIFQESHAAYDTLLLLANEMTAPHSS